MDRLKCTCGGVAEYQREYDEDDSLWLTSLKCNKCGFTHGDYIGHTAKDACLEGWQAKMKHARYAVTDQELRQWLGT